MSRPRVVFSQPAEESMARIKFTLAAELVLARSSKGTFGRLHRHVSALPGANLVLPHLVAIAEEFSRRLLFAVSDPLVTRDHPLRAELWRLAERQADSTWSRQQSAWKKWHGIDLKQFSGWDELCGFIDARNALMHGLGELTRRQLGADGGRSVRERMSAAGLVTSGRRLILDGASAGNCAAIAGRFIGWLDGETVDIRPARF